MSLRFGTAALSLVVLLGSSAVGADPARPEPAMIKAAEQFTASLDPAKREVVLFPFKSDERLNWHYIPKDRKGLPLTQMSTAERTAALGLLRSSLSDSGYGKATGIRELEAVLHRLEKGSSRFSRDPDLYYFTIFGTPSASGTWGWRYEGHHYTLNVTMDKGRIVSSSPQFLGANPAEVPDGKLKGKRTLAAEEDQARELLASLGADQSGKAHFSTESPREILSAAERRVKKLKDDGIAYGELTAAQRKMLVALIETHAATQPPAIAGARLDEIRKAGLEKVRFAWAGSTKRREPHYYRVQGPTFLVEYANTQNDANHIHVVWRDFDGDFGLDVLALHYQTDPHDGAQGQMHDTRMARVTGNAQLGERIHQFLGR